MSHLKGMAEIRKYTGRTDVTIIKWVFELGFPATKIPPSIVWESDTELIDEWRKTQIIGGVAKRPDMQKEVKRKIVKRQGKKKK